MKANHMKKSLIAITLILFSVAPLKAKDQTVRMNKVIDNLIASYNAVDSVNYRRHFSSKMLVDNPISEIGEALRSGNGDGGLGTIVSVDREISDEGKRAIVLLHFEKNLFDMHLRLNNRGKLTRDNWLPHKEISGETPTMSFAEIDAEKALYEKQVKQFAQAFLESDASMLDTLFQEDEDDPKTHADNEQLINRFRGRGEFKRAGAINYLGNGDVSVPLMISDDEGYEFVLTFNSVGKIYGLRLTNWAPKESVGKSLADIGADTLRTVDLKDISQLGDAFRAGSGKVRFVTLLSPT